jgi:hypothetical protein
MPAAFAIDRDCALVVCRLWGSVDDADLVALARGVASHRAFRPDFAQVVDMRGIERARMTLRGVEQAAAVRDFAPGARRAFLVSVPVVYGLVRMYQHCRDDASDEIRIFPELDQALPWLGMNGQVARLLERLPGEAQPA